jgi:hypothetical protein
MTTYWFRPKRYGWGWSPATVQGWLVLGAFVAAVAADSAVFYHRVRAGVGLRPAMTMFYLWIAILVVALAVVCWRTGEPPHWRWGDRQTPR